MREIQVVSHNHSSLSLVSGTRTSSPTTGGQSGYPTGELLSLSCFQPLSLKKPKFCIKLVLYICTVQGGAAGGGAEQVHQRLLDRVQTLQAELHRQSGERESEMIITSSMSGSHL